MKTKDRLLEAAKRLRDAARLQDPMAKVAVDLIALAAEDTKEKLVGADGDDMLRLQGAAREFRRMHMELTTTPPAIKPEENI